MEMRGYFIRVNEFGKVQALQKRRARGETKLAVATMVPAPLAVILLQCISV